MKKEIVTYEVIKKLMKEFDTKKADSFLVFVDTFRCQIKINLDEEPKILFLNPHSFDISTTAFFMTFNLEKDKILYAKEKLENYYELIIESKSQKIKIFYPLK